MRDVHERVALRFAKLVAQVPPDAWHRPTPCTDWDVRALVDHAFGPAEVEVPESADTRTRLLGILGRRA